MAISEGLASTLRGKARTSGLYFDHEYQADEAVVAAKAEGRRNVRKARFHDYTTSVGTKIYRYVVRWDA